MLGGLGICGQPFCCSRFLKEFQPVSIKMAKEQGLSLNPTKISGSCGRLMCCLSYEQKAYEYLNGITPMPGSIVAHAGRRRHGGGGKPGERHAEGAVPERGAGPKYYKRSECTYLRGGKRAPRAPDPEEE